MSSCDPMGEAPRPLRVGVLQMQSGPDPAANLQRVEEALAVAESEGVGWVVTPENALLFAPEGERRRLAQPIDGAWITRLREACQRHGVALLVGSFPERSDDAARPFNTAALLDRHGSLLAAYRKAHLFDVRVDAETTFQESASTCAGPARPVVARLDGWVVGLSICYDLRFPAMYRALVDAGAELLCVPAAFTPRTGAAHWEVLLRARAIESAAFVVAPAQAGEAYPGRVSHGESLVCTPWGDVVHRASRSGASWSVVTLDLSAVVTMRAAIPAWRGGGFDQAIGPGKRAGL